MASMTAVLMAVTMTAVVASATTTHHRLLNRNTVDVTESPVKCKNGKSVSVTTGARGVLNELSTVRTDFKGEKWRKRMAELDREADDEQGHVVGSVFGGPIATWNLVPQHRSVNRRINAQASLLNRWDEFEKWAREELGKKNGAPVRFAIRVKYAPANGCRPVGFEIEATSKAGVGFSASFDNGPFGSFAVSSASQRPPKRKKT